MNPRRRWAALANVYLSAGLFAGVEPIKSGLRLVYVPARGKAIVIGRLVLSNN